MTGAMNRLPPPSNTKEMPRVSLDVLRRDFRAGMWRSFGMSGMDPLSDNLLAPRRVAKIQAPLGLMDPRDGDAPLQGYAIETPDGYAMHLPQTYNRQQIGAVSNNYNQQLGNLMPYEAFVGKEKRHQDQ